MNINEEKISNEAIIYVKRNKNEIIKRFADPKKYLPTDFPVSVFMAGSPGAGKTEFSKELLNILFGNPDIQDAVRIDPDEVRGILPGYGGKNAYIFQSAVSVAIEKIHDSALKNKQNFILDGTLAFSFDKAKENIQRSISKQRIVFIFYVYQNPVIAWRFTQKREEQEGRRTPKEASVDQFFKAKENVNTLKNLFGDRITLYIVEKDFENKRERIWATVDKIDSYIKCEYTKDTLKNVLENL